MAEREYDSIIDAMLDQREPDWKDLDLEAEHASGEEVADRTHQYVDKDFEDDIAESASKHTPIWGPKAGADIYENRIAEKETAAPRIHSVTAYRRMDEYKSKDGDDASMFDEVTESIEKAHAHNDLAENSAAKKEVSDAEIQNYVRQLLNQGTAPAKVAEQLEKRAELELFNHQMATDYLQRNAGLMGLAYLEPNTYMDKYTPTYERTAGKKPDLGGAACVAQKRAWDAAGIKPQAKSVKQVAACQGCEYFNKDARSKACNLYHLPVVSSTQELSQIVNHLTAGVPEKRKHAALVQIANGSDKKVANPKVAEQTNVVKTADAKVRNQEKRASYEFYDNRESSKKFSSEHVAKLHAKGASLEQIYKWAEPKFGSVETSFAFRGFVQSLRKNASGRIEVASGDLKFLNGIGIRNAAFEGKAKCASCPAHFASQHRPIEDDRGAQRIEAKFASSTIDKVRGKQAEAEEVSVTAAKVRKLHQAGHSVEKIYVGAARKVGSVEARKAVAGFVEGMKKVPGKIAVSASDRAFLIGKLGFKPEQVRMLDPQRRPVTQVVASVPDDQNLLSYPGMAKHAGEKKATDGHAILAEYDLTGGHDMQDIDTSGPKREDVELDDHFKVDLE